MVKNSQDENYNGKKGVGWMNYVIKTIFNMLLFNSVLDT